MTETIERNKVFIDNSVINETDSIINIFKNIYDILNKNIENINNDIPMSDGTICMYHELKYFMIEFMFFYAKAKAIVTDKKVLVDKISFFSKNELKKTLEKAANSIVYEGEHSEFLQRLEYHYGINCNNLMANKIRFMVEKIEYYNNFFSEYAKDKKEICLQLFIYVICFLQNQPKNYSLFDRK